MSDSRKCEATRQDGEPCQAYAIKGGNVCRVHGGSAPQVKKKAKERLAEAAGGAAKSLVDLKAQLEEIIENEDLAPSEVKAIASEARKQATEILDRAGEDGAPKVSRQELTGEDGGAVEMDVDGDELTPELIDKLADAIDS
jgi:hypothetical protein